MSLILFILIVTCIFVYSNLYLKPNKDFQLIQANLNNFTEGILYEKNPFIIYDEIVNMYEILNTVFKYQYVLKQKNIIDKNKIYKSKSKYALVHNNSDTDLTINLMSPFNHVIKSHIRNNKNASYFYDIIDIEIDTTQHVIDNSIGIIVKPYNMLSIPAFWMFKSNSNAQITYLSDFIHVIATNYLKYSY